MGLAERAARLVSPRAVGVRAPWTAMPESVRAWVADELGSPVAQAHDQVGGMSPGCATRLVCEDGTRAFVKAVGAELNPVTPILFRREVTGPDAGRVARAVGGPARVVRRRRLGRDPARGRRGHASRPRRRRHHGPAAPRDRAVLGGAGRAGARPTRTRPGQRRAGRPAAPASTTGPTAVARAAEVPPDLLPDWVRRDTGTWEPLVRSLALHDVRPGELRHPQRQPPRAAHR